MSHRTVKVSNPVKQTRQLILWESSDFLLLIQYKRYGSNELSQAFITVSVRQKQIIEFFQNNTYTRFEGFLSVV